MAKNILSASILSADFSALGNAITQCEESGCDWIHIDVMDGHFVPNITMGPFIVDTCRTITQLPLDVHLMIDNSERFIEPFINAGASNLTIHIERNHNILRTLQQIRLLGAHPGVAINPGTPASSIEAVLPFVDMVLVMTVNPGFSGQSFMPECLPKIASIKSMVSKQNHAIRVQVDGGMTKDTVKQCLLAGADTFVAATAIFKHINGINAGIAELREVLK
ncbi:MAG: ribulose-phosphate 3-epimerase [Anaerolineaceae bacterium]